MGQVGRLALTLAPDHSALPLRTQVRPTCLVRPLWDLPVALSTTVGLGTAIVGGFAKAAQIARRGGVVVEATNSHDDYFTRDLVAIRCEQRQALLRVQTRCLHGHLQSDLLDR